MTAAAPEIDLFTLAGPDQRVSEVSEAFTQILGRPAAEVSGRALADLLLPEDRVEVTERVRGFEDEPATLECRFVQGNGQAVFVQWVARPLEQPGLWRVVGTDTADLVKLLDERRRLRTRLDLAVGQAVVAMWDLDLETGAFAWEPQAAVILGVPRDAVPGDAAALAAIVHPADADGLHAALAALEAAGSAEAAVRVGADHTLRHLSFRGRVLEPRRAGDARRAVGLLLDVTVEKALEEQLLRMSVSDGLTGVRNRRGFDQALRAEWRRAQRSGQPLSVLMIDVDHFKALNDAHGHLVGDQALVALARAVSDTLFREGDVLARYGGEEFAVILPGTGAADAAAVADRILAAVRAVTLRQAPGVAFTVSIGTSTWTPDTGVQRATDLVAQADAALYAAKAAGRDRATP